MFILTQAKFECYEGKIFDLNHYYFIKAAIFASILIILGLWGA